MKIISINDNFEKLENLKMILVVLQHIQWSMGSITDAKMCALLEKAYNKWTAEY